MTKRLFIAICMLTGMVLTLHARMYQFGEQVYINTDQTSYHVAGLDINWKDADAKLFLYFFQSTNDTHYEWVTLTSLEPSSNVYRGTLVCTYPWYDKVIVVRKAPYGFEGDWDYVWTQTCDINIPDNDDCSCNYIENFDCGAEDGQWRGYAPTASSLPSVSEIEDGGVTPEQIRICPVDLGGPFSLRVKLNAAKTEYDYSDVKGHGWYQSTDGTTWTEVAAGKTGVPMNGIDDDIDLNSNQLPATLPGGVIYYYLHSSIISGRRLIRLSTNSSYCSLDCDISSFETAVSNVNADDNTYTLDGMVAFGEANGKQLVIACDGKDTTIAAPVSPQSFSLHGVPAATEDGKKTKAYAYFIGGSDACRDSIVIDVPNATEAVQTVTLDSLTGQSFVLKPVDADENNAFVWLAKNKITGVWDTVLDATQILTVAPMDIDSTLTLIYKEYYPNTGTMDDLMANGNYESDNTDGKYGTYGTEGPVSAYDFWGYFKQTGTTQINFYDNNDPAVNPSLLKDNGFAVVQNAHYFYPTYANVKAKEGSYFALIDAKTGAAGGNMQAWRATTTDNSNLKLKKGTTYVLSFWAANINNYGEMDNAAKFKFYIEDITNPAKPVKIDSSEVLDLSQAEYRNNLWHQCSKTVQAKQDYNNIRISVVNLNNNVLNVGNDFALDDIQFHPISTVSKVVKSQQQFVITAHQPKVDAFTATVMPLDCDADPEYTVKMHVAYQNPKGRLIIKDITTGTEYPYTLPDVAFDTPATLDKDIVITGLSPDVHTWEAYFEDWTTAKISDVSTTAPVIPTIDTAHIVFGTPGCTDLNTTLTFDLDYTYQQGTLTYWVDGITPKASATYSVADKTKQTLTALTFANIPADGKNNHVLHVSFDGTNSCVKSYNLPAVPLSPVISSVTVTGVPATVPCGASDYTITVTVTTPYDATGRNIVLSSGAKDTTVQATGTSTVVTIKKSDVGGSAQTVTAAYEATPTCSLTSAPFTPPTYSIPVITIAPIDIVCDDEATIDMPFTIVSGNPDTYDLAIGTTHYTGTVSGSDISFALTSQLAAGDYTGVVTAGSSLSDCSTQVTVNFTVADGSCMLSKWTDVLFIDNSDGLFVSYQWYENGSPMVGETQQRLYNPNGLTGSYYCRMTTTDGKTIYTCEEDFDDVTPSRCVNNDEPGFVINRYRVSPHVYVIQERVGDQIITRKILTQYE